MIDDPFASLKRGPTVGRRELALLFGAGDAHEKTATDRKSTS